MSLKRGRASWTTNAIGQTPREILFTDGDGKKQVFTPGTAETAAPESRAEILARGRQWLAELGGHELAETRAERRAHAENNFGWGKRPEVHSVNPWTLKVDGQLTPVPGAAVPSLIYRGG